MKIRRRFPYGSMFLSIVVSIIFMVPFAWSATVWKGYGTDASAIQPPCVEFVKITEIMNKETAGDFQIQFHAPGSLPINTLNLTQAVGDGIIQMAGDGFYLGTVTIGGILRLPMLISTEAEFATASKILLPYMERGFEKQNCLILGDYMYPAQVAWSAKKLTSLADMAGQKMRVTSPEQAEFVKRFKGIPVTISAPEVASALERGVANGVFTASVGGGRIWKEFFKYTYRFSPNFFSSVFIVNKKAFNELPEKYQTRLREVTAQACRRINETHMKEEDNLTKQFQKEGMIVVEGKAADYDIAIKTMADYWDAWAKSRGPEHVEALAKVRKALGK